MEVVPGLLWTGDLKRFVIEKKTLVDCKCMQLPVLYCCDISESKGMAAFQHVVLGKGRCVTCLLIKDDVIRGKIVGNGLKHD